MVIIVIEEKRRRQHHELRESQAKLEDRVRERTAQLDAANRSLRDLSARLLQMQDEERRRIARELHDSVGQLLVGLSLNMSTVRAEIERLTKAAAVLNDSESLIQEMSKEVRTISHLLHPPLWMRQAWHPRFAGTLMDSCSAATSKSISIVPMISGASHVTWKLQCFVSSKSASRIFTGIRGARRQAFVVGVSKREFCYR